MKTLLKITLLSTVTYTALSLFSINSILADTFVTKASWYGHPFHGRKTASGEKYNMYKLTVAHKTLPLGSKVKIDCAATGKSIIATVTDRGPYVRGRSLDLSYGTAKALGIIDKGVATVSYSVIK